MLLMPRATELGREVGESVSADARSSPVPLRPERPAVGAPRRPIRPARIQVVKWRTKQTQNPTERT